MRGQPDGRETPVRATTQSATYQNNYPDLAIDGNIDTFSIAVSNQNWQHAWWQGDLGLPYQVTGLTIVSSPDYTSIDSFFNYIYFDYLLIVDVFLNVSDAQYLKNFEVLVSQHDYTHDPQFQQSQNCLTVSDSGVIPTKTLIAFKCSTPLFGRFVIIKSTTGPISLAEVKIYIQ